MRWLTMKRPAQLTPNAAKNSDLEAQLLLAGLLCSRFWLNALKMCFALKNFILQAHVIRDLTCFVLA